MSSRTPSPNRRAGPLCHSFVACLIRATHTSDAPEGLADAADDELIQVAGFVCALWAESNKDGLAEEVSSALLSVADAGIAVATSLPATTPEGMAAKARMLRIEYLEADASDPAERLMQSLLSDLIRQGGRA